MVPSVLPIDEMVRIAAPGRSHTGVRSLLARLPADAPEDWRNLAVALALRTLDSSNRVLGISGGQGAGKTTLARLTCQALEALGVASLSLSIDDFYLSRSERATLARDIHPLLATRGVPGTHDVRQACRVIGELLAGRGCSVPVFDKARDDQGKARRVEAAVDVVVFEGWCLGVRPQPAAALVQPCNLLEAQEDGAAHWRTFVNERLRLDYPALWSLIDDLLFLAVPDLAAVRRWRSQQEAQLAEVTQARTGSYAPRTRSMNADELARFIAHYERITLWALEDLPGHADLTGRLGTDHELLTLRSRLQSALR